MNSKFINFLKDLIGPNYYKLFPQIFGIGYERYKVNLIQKKLTNKKINPITYLDERIKNYFYQFTWDELNKPKQKQHIRDAFPELNKFGNIKPHLCKAKGNVTLISTHTNLGRSNI